MSSDTIKSELKRAAAFIDRGYYTNADMIVRRLWNTQPGLCAADLEANWTVGQRNTMAGWARKFAPEYKAAK